MASTMSPPHLVDLLAVHCGPEAPGPHLTARLGVQVCDEVLVGEEIGEAALADEALVLLLNVLPTAVWLGFESYHLDESREGFT